VFSLSKPSYVFLASFSGFFCTSNRTNEEVCLAALTQKKRHTTLGSFQLAQVWGILDDAIHSRNRTRVVERLPIASVFFIGKEWPIGPPCSVTNLRIPLAGVLPYALNKPVQPVPESAHLSR